MRILIDNGHGVDTPGKCSPDGLLREGVWTRQVARMLAERLQEMDIDAHLLVPEDTDESITERVHRANAECQRYGADNVVLVSIHVNAAASRGWHTARGWMAIVDDYCSERARRFADILYDEAMHHDMTTRSPLPGRRWWLYGEAIGVKGKRLGLLRGTRCAAVLTENLFMDNPDDAKWLLTPKGQSTIVSMHAIAIARLVGNVSCDD